MYLKSLALKNFRNIKELTISDFQNGMNVFVGNNAQGKTNLIEAINYLSCARSFRTNYDDKLILNQEKKAYLCGVYQTDYFEGKTEAMIFSDRKKSVLLNGIPIKKLSEMIGRLNTVVFSPEDLNIVKDRPQLRRKLMDLELSKLRPSYYSSLLNYMTVLKNKNKLLKEETCKKELIEAFNEQIICISREIIQKRREYLVEFAKFAKEAHFFLTDGEEELTIQYLSCVEGQEIEEELRKKLEHSYNREKFLKMSMIGPHREDLLIRINGKDIRTFASQGQQRTATLSIKLACLKTAEYTAHDAPILLLDDVFSELDKRRKECLISKMKNIQVFITATDLEGISNITDIKIYEVSNGKIK